MPGKARRIAAQKAKAPAPAPKALLKKRLQTAPKSKSPKAALKGPKIKERLGLPTNYI